MFDSICNDLRRFIGQPVNIFTEDGRIFHGTEIHCYEDSVRIIERNEDIILIPFRHIVAVQQPKMCARRKHKECCDCDGFEGCRGKRHDRDCFEDRDDFRRDRRDRDCFGDRDDFRRDRRDCDRDRDCDCCC